MRLLRPWHHSTHLSPTSTLSHVSCTVSIYQNIRTHAIVYMYSNLVKAHEWSKPPPYPSCDWCFLFVFLLSIPHSLGTNDCQSLDLHWYLCPHIPYHTVNHSNVMMQRYNVLINLLYHPSHQPCHEFPTLPESTSGYVRTGSEPCACGSALVRLGTKFCFRGFGSRGWLQVPLPRGLGNPNEMAATQTAAASWFLPCACRSCHDLRVCILLSLESPWNFLFRGL